MRETQKGDLMFKLKKYGLGKTDGVRNEVKNWNEGNAAVRPPKTEDLCLIQGSGRSKIQKRYLHCNESWNNWVKNSL